MPEDFIYYTRDIELEIDSETVGNITERVRPDGSQRTKILSGMTVTLDKVSQGHLLYFVEGYKNTANKYYFSQDYTDFDAEQTQSKQKIIFYEPSGDFPDEVYGVINRSNDYLALASKGSSMVLYRKGEEAAEVIYNQKTKILYADSNNVYFVIDYTSEEEPNLTTAKLYKINYFDKQNQELAQKI